MRAIIIDDKDCKDVLDKLKLEKLDGRSQFISVEIQEKFPNEIEIIRNELHRRFHYVVCSWLQEQGYKHI
jgi:hypothetical protein